MTEISGRGLGAGTSAQDVFRFIALDVETANGNSNSICQIGLAMVPASGPIQTLGVYVDPQQPFEGFNTRLHGIDASTVRGAPHFGEVLAALRPLLERHTLIQHSAFDKRAMNAACDLADLPQIDADWLDSVTIARRAWPELKGNGGHGLASLKRYLELSFDHHDAEEDARAAAEVVLHAEAHTGAPFTELAQTAQQRRARLHPLQPSGTAATGHVVCFSGQLSISHTKAARLAASAGAVVKATVTRKVTLVVMGAGDLARAASDQKSTKHRLAEDLMAQGHGIQIIGEQDFFQLIQKSRQP